MKIMIVDDSEFMRNVIRKILEVSGYTDFIEADSGSRAMMMLPEADIILTDLNMPGMDGELLIREIRKSERYHNIPICVITGQNNQRTVANILKMGVDDYITKPFNQQLLREKTERLEKTFMERRRSVKTI